MKDRRSTTITFLWRWLQILLSLNPLVWMYVLYSMDRETKVYRKWRHMAKNGCSLPNRITLHVYINVKWWKGTLPPPPPRPVAFIRECCPSPCGLQKEDCLQNLTRQNEKVKYIFTRVIQLEGLMAGINSYANWSDSRYIFMKCFLVHGWDRHKWHDGASDVGGIEAAFFVLENTSTKRKQNYYKY